MLPQAVGSLGRKARPEGKGGGGLPSLPPGQEGALVRGLLIPQGGQPPGQLVLLAAHGALAHSRGALRQLAELVQHL